MRCASCGARNPEGADFCSQCFTAFAPSAVDEPAPLMPSLALRPGDVAVLEDADPAAPDEADAGARFRRRGDDLDWRCGVCGTWNPIGATACGSCLQPFATTMGGGDPAATRDVSDEVTLITTMLLPGLGHILRGRSGTGVARACLFLLWGLGGFALLRAAATSGQPLLPAVVLLSAALIIWVASVADAHAINQGSGVELLRPRVFLWLVVAVVAALLAAFTVSALRLPTAGGA